MPYTVALPDGRTVEFPDSVSREDAAAIIRRQLGGATPATGLGAAFGKGIESLLGAGTTAAEATFGSPEEAARAGLQRQKKLEEKYADQVSLEKVKEAYAQRGLFPAVGEALSQIPYALAEQAPNLATALGGAKLGAMAGTAVAPGAGSALGAIIGGGLGAFAPSFIQQYGGNIERQAAEQEKAGKPLDISRTAAAAAATPQAALDVAATFIPLGRTVAGKVLGPEVKALLERGEKAAAEKLAQEGLGKTLVKGTAVGAVAEVPTEITQQMLERAQAGLSLTDDDALKEYGETAYQVGLLAPIGAAGRLADRGAAKQRVAAEAQAKAAEERKATAAAEEAKKKSPEYLEQTYNEYQQLLAQKSALDAQIKKGTTGAPLSQDDKDANAVINKQLAELKQPLAEAKRAYIDAGGPQAMTKLRAGRLELTTQPEETPGTEAELLTQQRARLEEELGRAQDRGDTERAAALQQQLEETAPETPEAQRARLMRDVAGLNQILEQQREQVKAAETPEAAVAAAQRAQQTYDRLTKLNEQLGKLPAAPDVAALKKKEKTLLKKFEDARESGEQNTVLKIAPQLIEVRRQLQAAQPFDLASEAYAAEEQRKLDALGEAMGAGRETAAYERTQAGLEQQTARDQAQRLAALQQELEFEGTAEREAMQERARSLVEQQRDKEAARFRTARQTTIPEPQERITRTMTETEGRLPPEVRSELAALKRELRSITRLPAQQEGLPTQEIAGPFSLYTTPAQVRDRVKAIQGRIRELERIPVDVTTTTETVGIPSEQPTIDTRPSPSVERQANALLERINASPKVDQDIKDLAAQVQDNLPQIAKQLRGMTEELAQRPPQRGVRVPPRAMPQGGDEVVQVAQWAQSVLRGAPAPDMTADLRTALQRIEVAQRSESEQVTQYAGRALSPREQQSLLGTSLEGRRGVMTRAPSGEISRAVQLEFPEMPEPRATAFASYKEFEDFLASKAPMLVGAQGQIALSISRLQRELAPLQAQVAELRRQEADLKQKSADLKAKTGADRAAAQALVNEAQFSFNIARNALENRIEVLIAARATAQQKYADAQAEAAQLRTTIANSVKEFEAAAAAEEEVRVAGPAGSQQQLGPVGQGFRGATIRQGELAGYEQARAAEQAVEKALDAWTAAETKLRDVIQANVGADWSDGSKALNEYLRAHDARKEAKLDLDNAKKELKRINAKRKVVTPMTDDAFGNFLVQQAELAAKLDVSLKRISGLSKYLKGILKYGAEDIDAYLKQREAAQKSLSAALQKLPEGGDVGAVLRQHMGPLRESYQRLADTVGEYRGSPEQIAAFEKAGADLQAAEQILAETVAAARPADAQAQALLEQATKTATDANRIAGRVQARLSEVQKRAEARRRAAPTPPETTLSEREAQDAEKRREEQARLERLEAIPATRVEFTRSAPENREIKRLIEALAATTNPQERAAARKALGDYLEGFIKRKDTELDDMKRKASKNIADFNKQRAIFAELTEKLKGDLTPKRRESAEKQRDEAKRKMEEHQRRYTLNTNEMKVTRTNIQAQREERNRLLAESSRTRVAGERLGPRAIGPVTRDEVTPPKTMRTGSEESRAGVTTTDARQRLEEARGMKQRDVAMSKKEMAQAQAQADKMKTLEGVEKAEKKLAADRAAALERGLIPGEFARFEAREAILKARRAELAKAAPAKPAAPVVEAPAKAQEAASTKTEREQEIEDLYAVDEEAFEAEILPTEGKYLFEDGNSFSRGATANPSTTASVRTELSKAFPNLGRVQIYDSVDALLKANPQYEGKIPSDARGFVDTAGNKAFLIAENIDQGQALSVLLHEVGAHIGLKNMLGDAQYNALVNAVKSWEKRTDNSTEAKVAKAARARVEAAETTAGQVNDELLAYTIEEAVNAGVKPTETKGVLGQWLSRVAALFRKALEKFGLPPKTLDAQGIVDMAFGAAKMEMRPAVPQVSRRQFLRGAGAALGAMKLPPLSKEMNLRALRNVFEASLDARGAWFDALKAAVKTKGLGRVIGQYEDLYEGDNPLVAFTQSDALQSFLYNTTYDENYQGDGYDYYLNELLSGKDGLKVVADLQQALRAQAAGLVEAVQKTAKEKGLPEVGELYFSKNLPTASRVAGQLIASQPTIFDNIKQSLFGLSFRTQWIDALAPIEKIANTVMDSLKGAQTMYYLRAYGMRNNMTAQAVGNGVPQLKQLTRADGQKEWVIESEKGVNIKDIVKRLATKDVVKEAGSADAANRLFTLYMAALRGERVGFEKLNFGRAAAQYELKEIEKDLASPRLKAEDKPRLLKRKAHLEQNIADMPTEADIRAAKAEIEANPTLKAAFSDARDMYNEYNANLLKLLVDTGAMSKEKAAELLRNKDYIPYYRIRGGNAELVIGKETPIRVGNIKDSPHLQELIGGEEPIFNFLDSSVQNTSMLLDMAMRNIAVKNLAYELASVGLTRSKKPVQTPKIGAPQGAMEFKIDGVDYYVVPDTEYIGVPSDLLVKGMAGIPTMMPVAVRLMGIPAQILRRAVTSTPVFAAKQLFRDSLAAFMLSGSNGAPLLGAIRQLGKTSPLEARGVTGGQTFTGMPDDISRLLREMQEGRPGWSKAFAKMEALSLEADAATRRSQYESYLKQGLSEMEASLMSLESMNFSKRGLSPTMHMVTTLVPFFNAQIQGLDVMYKALTGKLPFNDKLDIQRKLFTRGAMMFIGTMAYAAAMQDDEEYKNAPPDVKYGNWFLRLPFLDEMAGEKVTLRVPIPFEVGYIFKALPEMLYNSMQSDQDAKDALKALNHILIQIIPGGSSMVPIELGSAKIPVPVPIPTALKPVIEVGLGKSFFTGRDLESAREQQEVPGMRYRTGTSEIAKYVGEAVNFSPIKIEALVNGYTGGLGMALLQAASLPLPSSDVAKPDKRLSELPLVGSMFQPADAANIIDGVYKDFQKVTQAKTTYDRLVERGELGKAQAFLQENMKSIALASFAGDYKNQMGELTKAERVIRGATTMSSEDKRKALDNIKQAKIQIATAVRAFLESSPDRTEPQAVPQ